MRIEEIHVYGFGQLQDVSFRFQNGINVIEGLNEAGKTTLMAFIRGVLFGFESRRNPELRYEPTEGGKFGGVIVLTDADGQAYRVERIFQRKIAGDVTVQLPDGGEEGEPFLNRLLGNMNEKVFKNIFAFGLSELQQIETLHEDEINHFIYTAGTGDGNTIRAVQKELIDKEQALFRPNGTKATINQKLQRIREAGQELIRLKQQNEQYEQFTAQLEELDRFISQEEASIESWKKSVSQHEKTLAHYDDYTNYISLQDRLKSLPYIDRFPEDGVARLEALEKNIRDWKAKLADLEGQRSRLQEQLYRTDSDYETVLRFRMDIEDLRDKLSQFREQKEQAERCLLSARREQERFAECCTQLGPSWTEEMVVAFDTSIAVKQSVREYITGLGDLKAALTLANNGLDKARKDIADQTAQLEAWQEREPAKPPKSEQELEDERRELDRAKELDRQQSAIDNRIAALKDKINDYTQTQTTLSQSAGRAQSSFWKWGLLALTIAAPVLLWLLDQTGAAVVVFGILAALTVREFMNKPNNLSFVDDVTRKREAAERELSHLQQESDGLQSQMDHIRRQYVRTDDTLREWESGLEKDREMLRQWERWKEQTDDKEQSLRQAHAAFTEAEQKREHCRRLYQEKVEEWKQWLRSRQLPCEEREDGELDPEWQRTLSPDSVLEMIRDIEVAKEAVRRTKELQSERGKYEQFTADYITKLQTVLHHTKLAVTTADPEFQVRELSRALEKAREEARLRKQTYGKLEEIEEEIRSGEHRLQVEAAERAQLLQQGGADNEDVFRLRAGQYRERKQLEQERDLLYRSLDRLSEQLYSNESRPKREPEDQPPAEHTYDKEEVVQLLDERFRMSKPEIADDIRELQQKMSAARERVKQWQNERAALTVKIEQLVSGTELSEQTQRYEQLVTALRQDAKEWAVIALGKHLLQGAMHLYEQEKQPGVLQSASRYLQQLTEGRYVRVLTPVGEQVIEVERRDGRRVQPVLLSRGTVEQLYLALRFALAEEYTPQAVLPLVLDDIFVNFDPYRTAAAIRALQMIAHTRQVFFFTCHAHICTMFEQEEVVHRRIELAVPTPQLQQLSQ